MQIRTTHFGIVEVAASDVFFFPQGMIGFEDHQQWVLLADEGNSVIGWLQNVFQEAIALPVISPRRFLPDYRFHLPPDQLSLLQADNQEQIFVLTVVAKNDGVLTANLKAPVIINLDRRLGRQVVVSDDHPLQHVLVPPVLPLRRSA